MALVLADLSCLLALWGSPAFNAELIAAVNQLDIQQLPLQQSMQQGSYVCDVSINPMVLSAGEESAYLWVNLGVFYTGIIAGCQCADDPTSANETNEYCELQLRFDKHGKGVSIVLL